ncbi:MAG: fumarylacetoacetate hydrolase family protein [bacterium]|jgi:2-keto-4-pentenoate hydratase/2-oxohepta-3-ene-1,7-dioic acid hydratase in catechol pathway
MTRYIRFSLNRDIDPTTPDGSAGVLYGTLEGETVREREGVSYPLSQVRLLPPCSPSKIVCVGKNYLDHAAEFGDKPPEEPLIFLKPPSALIAHRDCIVYPPISNRVDYEGELGVVIGRRARNLKREEVWKHVRGFTCVNDITARDLQAKDGQWTRAKGFDTFCAVGPWIVPCGEAPLHDLRIRTFVNDEKKQDASVRDMVFDIPRIIQFITEFMTLLPGDLIATGTPAGVGPLSPGSVVRVDIEGIGVLENTVIR